VLLRGGAALDTSYWKNTANLPTLGSDGSFAFDRASSQYLDKGQMTFSPGTNGFTATVKFKFTGTAGNTERLFDCGSGAPNNNLVFSRAETTATLTFYPCQGTSCTNHQWTLLSFIQNTVYIVTMVYDPSSASVAFYVGGALSQTVTGVPNLSTRTVSNCYIGKSWWSTDAFLSANIYYMGAYDRSLSNSDILLQHECAANCTTCPAGYFCPVSSAIWFTCMSGQHCPSVGVTAVACPSGTYSKFPGAVASATCQPCPAGSYSNSSGNSMCTCKRMKFVAF
jgi:hypothetical protein